jgi:hypothetical protein
MGLEVNDWCVRYLHHHDKNLKETIYGRKIYFGSQFQRFQFMVG